MLKVLHVITGLRQGGAEAVLARLIGATRSRFNHVVVSLRDQGHFGPLLQAAGVRVEALDIAGLGALVAGVPRLVWLIRQERPDVIQTWLYHADLVGGVAARLAGSRAVIWSVRNANLAVEAIGCSTRLVAAFSARLSGIIPVTIVCNSTVAAASHVAFGYRGERFLIIPNGYDVDRFKLDAGAGAAVRREFHVASTETLIGMVARWDAQKDHANLLEAIGMVARYRPGVRLLMAGSGIDPSNGPLRRLIAAHTLDGRVILAGSRNDVPAIMNALDLHVLSSLGEAFPNAVAEAMACGTPCVVTDVGDSAHIVGSTGQVARPRDAGDLAAAIERALVALQLEGRATTGARCRDRIVQHFSLARMSDAYSRLWREVGRQTT